MELIILVIFVVVMIMLMSGRKVTYTRMDCAHWWTGKKHYGGTALRCPDCGSSNLERH